MTTITPEVIANVKANGASSEEIEVLNNQLEEQEDEVGKTKGGANQGVGAASKNATSGSTELESENTSSESQSETKEEHKSVPPQMLITVGEKVLTFKEAQDAAKKEGIDTQKWISNNKGIISYDKEYVLEEVKVTGEYQKVDARVNELFEEELQSIYKVHKELPGYEPKSVEDYENLGYDHMDPKGNKSKIAHPKYGGLTEDEQSLMDNSIDPLTGIENVYDDDGNIIGVKRKGTNVNGNTTITSAEIRLAASNILDTLISEDDYLSGDGDENNQTFAYKAVRNVEKEFQDYTIRMMGEIDWDNDPAAYENYDKALRTRYKELMSREALADEIYQDKIGTINGIMIDKFEATLLNKMVEEEKSIIMPDATEGTETGAIVLKGLWQLTTVQIPNTYHNSRTLINGEKIHKINLNFQKANEENWHDETIGYIGYDGGKKNQLKFIAIPYEAKGIKKTTETASLSSLAGRKKVTWKEAEEMLREDKDRLGRMVMKDMAKSKVYQDELAKLGSPMLFDKNYKWSLDGDGYIELFSSQIGQMFLGTISMGGSTFIQELGSMSHGAITNQSALLHAGYDPVQFKKDKKSGLITKEMETKLWEDYSGLSAKEHQALGLKVLEEGHVDFDSLYVGAANSAGLDVIGNWVVLLTGGQAAGATKLFPRQMLNAFISKNYGDFFKGAKGIVKGFAKPAGQAILSEVITEGAQSMNSELTIKHNSPLKNFDWNSVANEAGMGAIIPGPLVLVTQSASQIYQAIRDKQLAGNKDQVKSWLTIAKNRLNKANQLPKGQEGSINADEYKKGMDALDQVELILENTNLKDIKNEDNRQAIVDALLRNDDSKNIIKELNLEIEKDTDGEQLTPEEIVDKKKEIAFHKKKMMEEMQIVVQEKSIDSWLQNSRAQAYTQNSQTEGVHKNRNTKIFKTRKEAIEYMKLNHPREFFDVNDVLNGYEVINPETGEKEMGYTYGANIPLSDGSMLNIAIDENVIAGIRAGDLRAGNVINHEQAHDDLSVFDDKELADWRQKTTKELATSKDPQMQQVYTLLQEKLEQYRNDPKVSTRTKHEEFFTALSDAFSVINMLDLSLDGSTTLSTLGEGVANLFEGNMTGVVDWKKGFDEQGVLYFIQSYTKKQRLEVKDVIAELREGKEPGVFEEGVEKGKDGVYVKDSRRVYPSGRTTEEIKSANSVLAKELIEQKVNTYPQYENNPALQKQVKDGEEKKLKGELIANNMGLVNKFLLPKANGGYYFDQKAGDVSYDDFSEAVMGTIGDIMNSYKPADGDFSMYLGGLMDLRIPGIWDKLVNDKEFATDLDNRKDEESSDYGDFMASFEDEVITIGGEETTKKAVTSKMRKTLGITDDNPLYNEILDDVIEVTIQNYDAINEEGFYQDTKERFQEKLVSKFKKMLGTPKSPKYKAWLTENVESLYNLLPQSAFNKSYDLFNDKGGRANVKQSEDKDVEFEKGVKIKSKTAGNRIATKKPFTPEIGEQFVDFILNPPNNRPETKQKALFDQLAEVIGFDAVSSAIDSKAFEDAHGTQQAVLGNIADKINRDMTVKFSHPVTGKIHEISDIKQLKDAGRLIRGVETSGLVDPVDTKQFIEELARDLKIDDSVAALVVMIDSKDIIEKGDAIKFKIDLMKEIKTTDPELYAELKKHKGIKGKKVVLDVIAEEVTNFTENYLDVDDMDALDLSVLGFHRSRLNPAETQHGPLRGDDSKAPLSGYGSNPKSKNLSYADNNRKASLLINGWTFNPKTNEFVNNETKVRSIDPVKEFGAEPTPAEYYETSQAIIAAVEAKRNDPNYVASEKWKDVRIMNVDYSGGLMKKISNILNDKKLTTRQQRVDKILKDHGAEIQAANTANIDLASHLSEKLVEAVLKGDMSKSTMIHLLQSQTNLAFGFRGLTKLEMISVLDGTYKENGSRAYGEHVNPNSGKMLGLAKIMLKATKDPNYNYKEAIAKLWSTHDQVILPSQQVTGEKGIDKMLKPTSTASYDRLKTLTKEQQENFIGINGESYKEALARVKISGIYSPISAEEIRIETAKKEFESERALEIQNQENKNIVVKKSLSVDFNKIIEVKTDIGAEKIYSKAQSEIQGADAGNIVEDLIFPPSAYDFEMFTYKYMTRDKEGEAQGEWFKEHLSVPYEKAIQAIDAQKQAIKKDYSALVKQLPQVEKNLNEVIEGTNYTREQAIRVAIWTDMGVDMQKNGLSKRDQKKLYDIVKADPELSMFADRLAAIGQQRDGYVQPTEYWTIESIAFDLNDMTGKAGRARYLAQWKKNKDEIFSEDNINKLRKAYGPKHVEALQDMLYRMEYGRNKSRPGRVEQEWNNWVNNSVGAVMFFNMRSAALQTISAVNYIDWENNHPGNAALAFANQPQYWKDFKMIFQSDYLLERRGGSKRTINEAELAKHVAGKSNKAKAALAWMLEKGFLPTQLADSFAIASGGATFYRNQVNAYEKAGMSTKEAEAQAFLDFRDKTEKGQQSSRADMISQQQAGGLGRLILAFKNTPMQYTRTIGKAFLDAKNNRGSLKANLSKIAYYGVVQSVVFNSLQTALFSALGEDDGEELSTKKERVMHGVIDGFLGGLGVTGAVAVTIKNGYMMYRKQKARGFRADHTRTIIQFANLSPTIGSKLRKLYSGIQTEAMNQGAIKKMGLTVENPAFSALANIVSATTNIPADRVVNKINNIILASSSETEAMDRIALLMGWNAWDLGIKNTKAKEANILFRKEKREKKKTFDFNLQLDKNKFEEQKNIKKQKQERKEGKKVTCSYNTSKGRCGVAVVEGGTRCTIHQKVEQRKDGKKTQCTKIKSNKKRCGVITANKSGLCYYHD